MTTKHIILMNKMMCFLFHLLTTTQFVGSNFIQCPYAESECADNLNCGSTAMGRRAGFFCNSWPFYSGGFAECCDENEEYSTCTHAVYNQTTNMALCDFWYMTQQNSNNELQLCDCKINNGEYCVSWICATIANYDFVNKTKSEALLSKLLLPNNIEIFGVEECGFFDDDILINNDHVIKQWCYKYDDFKSCYCLPTDSESETESDAAIDVAIESEGYCRNWVCHKYLNNAKNDLSLNDDYNKVNKHLHDVLHDNAMAMNRSNALSSSAIDMLKLSTKISHEAYKCVDSYSNLHKADRDDVIDLIDKAECTSWKANLVTNDKFSVMQCGIEAWNSNSDQFTQDIDEMRMDNHHNTTSTQLTDYEFMDELRETYVYKWQCHESGMDKRVNKHFLNFYLSTIIWSFLIGFVGLFLIFWYMKRKYISLSSFFCVQGWFFFIFGSIAAVHGGFASFFIYFLLQFIILGYVLYLRCQNRGKQPYGSISQRYDFEPAEVAQSVDKDKEDAAL